ncbi:MAG: nuclear transport factor 2 family protein [Actinobacteria bacterium]|nr:nuclear transport factor 2 family protein [Actinomycetota bacterium]
MTDINGTIDTYLAMLNELDADKRAALVATVFTPDAEWVDPPLESAGHAGISDMVGTIYQHYPAHSFRRTSAVDAHHDVVRFTWELVGPDGAVAFAGLDVAHLADDDRLRRVTGFIGELAAA